MTHHHLLSILLILLIPSLHLSAASPRLQGIACRSVHLQYSAPRGQAFYNEVTVSESHSGTYFCVCGFRMGYYGIQQLADDRKVLLFSVWDPGQQDDPNSVAQEDRVKLLYRGQGVRIGRFGNEGTGGQCFYDYDWKVGQTYRFLVRAKVEDEWTAFSAYFFLPEQQQWKHLVTFQRRSGESLRGYYSFVEDFRRNRVSATLTRTARFGNAWVCDLDGRWSTVEQARFTADGNPVMNINAGTVDGRFFLSTGGEIENSDTPLNETIRLKATAEAPPADVPTGDEATK